MAQDAADDGVELLCDPELVAAAWEDAELVEGVDSIPDHLDFLDMAVDDVNDTEDVVT